ncbi:MAG: CPBP family intramembrane metalloprotease [Sedimentisphaerales bacterium]|nr:CPBP family intramembrane metalloprotease [Sedimentisphaerales bacterium]
MKTVVLLCILAAVLWFGLFSPWTKDLVPFWPAMTTATGLLAGTALALGRQNLHDIYCFSWIHLLIGIVSAGLLYLIFWIGHKLSTLVLPFASDQVAGIYGTREQESLWVIGLLLFFWIGPTEEVFWRGFVQHRFARRSNPLVGLLITSAIYTLVHLWSFNLMLLVASAVCGLFWGAMFYRFGSVWPGLISHALWDLLIFILVPIQ